MKKILFFFTLLAVSLSAVANDLTFVFSEHGYTNGQDFDGETIDLGSGISIALSKGEGGTTPKYYDTSTAIRLYSQNTATFSITSGKITKIVFTYGNTDSKYATTVEDTYNYNNDETTGTWTGSASSVTLKYNYTAGHARLQKVVITYTGTLPVTTLNSYGMATFSASTNLSIKTEGVKAYKASVNGEKIVLTELEGYIPAGTGVILRGTAGTTVEFEAPAASATAANVTGNALKATTKADGSLANKEANSQALKGETFLEYTGATYTANRAYLVR